MHSVEDFVEPLLGRVLQVKDEREDELVIDVAKYESSQSLHMLRETCPTLGGKPVYLAPFNACNSVVDDILSIGFGSETQQESDYDYSHVEDDRNHSNNRYLLQECNLLLHDEEEIEDNSRCHGH